MVTSGGDKTVESVRQMGNNFPVKETVEIIPEARESCITKTLHLVTEASLAPTTEAAHTATTTKTVTTKPCSVTHLEDSIILSQYPWKSKLEVHLERLSEIELDIWCNHVVEYYKFSSAPEITPVIRDVKGYGLCKCQLKDDFPLEEPSQSQSDTLATDKLIDQANALIKTAKTFITKPVKRKHGSKSFSASSTSRTQLKANALDSLQEQTVRNLTTLHVGTDRTMTPSNKMPTPAKRRKIRCKLCVNTFSSVKELNTHHHKDHGIVQCPDCGKYFSMQSSLDKHSYSHKEAKYSCELCGKCFQFESRLNQHMVTHINKKLPCPKKSCDREFKNIGDLNCHMNVHTKGGWYYCDKCSYKNKDKRNTNSHRRKHDKPEGSHYECDKCRKKN